jgi:glycosyltransferase involved in cell wall biosynthesis
MPIFLERYNFDNYDVLLSMGSIYPHCLLTKPDTSYLCYLLTPNRYLYKPKSKIPAFFRKLDSIYIKRPDQILTISQTTAARIKDNYHINPRIISPGVDTDFFVPDVKHYSSNYYLCVSRLVPYKKIDLAIKACGELNLQLKIVGKGRSFKKLKLLAKQYSNISFEGEVPNSVLRQLYQNCKGLISPQLEDFGLANLEVQACGKPVIAFNKGGNAETIVNEKTGVFFNQQNIASLKQAILDFEQKTFSVADCRQQALKFSEKSFMLNLSNTIHDSIQKPKTTG